MKKFNTLVASTAFVGILLATGAPASAYLANIDNFKVIKNGNVFFEDAFDSGGAPPNAPNFGFSAREIEVLRLIDSGMSNQRIADELFVALGTVKTHINNIYGKLEVRSRTQALARARQLNLLV